MKKLIFSLLLVVLFVPNAYSAEPAGKIWFTEPKDGAKVKIPFKACFAEEGLKVTKWNRDNVDGQGHHHLLTDREFPTKEGYAKRKGPLKIVHYKTNCITVRKPLPRGKHILRGLFTHNNHDPYFPVIGTTITVEITE